MWVLEEDSDSWKNKIVLYRDFFLELIKKMTMSVLHHFIKHSYTLLNVWLWNHCFVKTNIHLNALWGQGKSLQITGKWSLISPTTIACLKNLTQG